MPFYAEASRRGFGRQKASPVAYAKAAMPERIMTTKIQIIDGLLNLKEAAQLNDKLRFYQIFEHYYGVSEEPDREFIGCPTDYSLDEQQPERGYGDVLYRDIEGNLHFCLLFVEARKVGSGDSHVRGVESPRVQVWCQNSFSGKSREEILEAFQEWYQLSYRCDYTPPLLDSPPKVEDMYRITGYDS